MSPSVLVTILNWQSAAATLECVAAVRRSRGVEFEVLVVDNGSTDGSAAELEAVFAGEERRRVAAGGGGGLGDAGGDGELDALRGGRGGSPGRVHLLALDRNTGYAGGMNAALKYAAAETAAKYVLLLTPDALVAPETIAQLVAALDAEPGAGIAGPVVVYREGRDRLIGAGGAIDHRRVRAPLYRSLQGTEPYAVDWIDGCCMMLRLEVVRAVNGFDERYFLYFEETDLCCRVTRGGWRVLLVPGAEVVHEKVGAPPSYYYYYMNRNRYLFWRKNFGVRPARVALAIAGDTARLAASWTLSLLVPARRHRRADDRQRLVRQLRGMIAGARDFRRGRFGSRASA
jgi:GT2 family glycosyltransferase